MRYRSRLFYVVRLPRLLQFCRQSVGRTPCGVCTPRVRRNTRAMTTRCGLMQLPRRVLVSPLAVVFSYRVRCTRRSSHHLQPARNLAIDDEKPIEVGFDSSVIPVSIDIPSQFIHTPARTNILPSRHREQLISLFRRYSSGSNHDGGGTSTTSCRHSEEPSGCVEDTGMRQFVNDFPSLWEWAQGEGTLHLFQVVR